LLLYTGKAIFYVEICGVVLDEAARFCADFKVAGRYHLKFWSILSNGFLKNFSIYPFASGIFMIKYMHEL